MRGRVSVEECVDDGVFVFRKASLALIRKMVHYSSEVLLKEVCDSETGHHLPTVLVEITATVLDQEVNTHSLLTTHSHLSGCEISVNLEEVQLSLRLSLKR